MSIFLTKLAEVYKLNKRVQDFFNLHACIHVTY